MDFLADVIRTGTVLGVDAGVGPSVVARVLGDDYVASGDLMFGYDLVEFFWHRRPRGLGWYPGHFTVQAHRLPKPPLLTDLPALGLVPVDEPTPGYVRYWQPSSEVIVLVDSDSGELWSISSAFGHRFGPTEDAKAVLQSMKHVVGLNVPERERWLERRDLTPDQWEFRCRVITHHTLTRTRLADRDAWAQFAIWAWQRTSPERSAIETAELLARLEDHFAGEYPSMPAADSVVHACLTHVTGTMSGTDRRLIDAAALHRHAVTDPSALDRWLSVRTDLPSAAWPQ